ncbi:MAG: T9SS type A sorting domain-containing protein [bacterium]|nr:T9SS type A sorting domain-containing protein [bacterium]
MKRVVLVIPILIGIVSYCFGTHVPVIRKVSEGWIGSGNQDRLTYKDGRIEEWIKYYNENPHWIVWAPADSQLATAFTMTNFPQVQYPFHIKRLRHIFYEHPELPWDGDQFNFRIYAGDGSTILYSSPQLTARRYPAVTEFDLGADSLRIDSGDFWVAVDVVNASGFPSSLGDGSWRGHSWFGIPGHWTELQWDGNGTELSNYAYVSWVALAHDVRVLSRDSPGAWVWVDTTYQVRATVQNVGLNSESFGTECIIMDEFNNVVYADTQQVTNLASMATRRLTFDTWRPALYDEPYTFTFATLLAGDMNPHSDTLIAASQSYDYGEISYDDGVPEAWYVVQSPNGAQDAFAVRFTPYFGTNICVKKAKVYVSGTTPFDYIGVFPGTATSPNMNAPYQKIQDPSATQIPGWIVVEFDTTLTQIPAPGNIWLVAKFESGQTGPGIGLDQNAPINNRSYWTQDLATWNTVGDGDWLMRIVHGGLPGIEETSSIPNGFKFTWHPNPMHNCGVIVYELPYRTFVSAKIYDMTGRLVTTLENSVKSKGIHKACWEATSVNSGIYFLKFTTGGATSGSLDLTHKLILLH